ncbi:MAG: hypothetical protein KBS61_02770 [Chryseobacterium sp.]|nr:hypothetical protein [Candidatus Chryseobacterium enterohippi]
MSLRKFYPPVLLLLAVFCVSCTKNDDESNFAQNLPVQETNQLDYAEVIDGQIDLGTLSIDVKANGNYQGKNDPNFIKNIGAPNFGYCHPDVQYFPNGFNGYQYWMVFTPYFGSLGNEERYENPTVVASNDGLNWAAPKGINTQLQSAITMKESISDKKKNPKQGFWSDVDWTFENNQFSLYYRASFINTSTLKKRGANSNNNVRKLNKNAERVIVRQTSKDGIHWSALEIVFNSNFPSTPTDNHILSPTFVNNGKEYVSFEVENNISPNFPGNEPSYVVRRTSKNGLDFSKFKQSTIVNFINKPWKEISSENAPWHIQGTYVDGYYFLLLAVGEVKKYTAESLYLAFSKDGINFKTLPKALVEKNVYRSSLFPMKTDAETIDFGAVIGFKSGIFKLRKFKLNKEMLDNCLKN